MGPIQSLLAGVLDDVRPNRGGQTAQYIAELATADPERLARWFATSGCRRQSR